MASEQGGGGVVVACQGGGSHSAFVASVLRVLLERRGCDIDALSGTSGGAVCAVCAWSGLLEDSPAKGIERLDAVWDATAIKNVWEAWAWDLGLEWIRVIGEVAAPEVSPYRLPPGLIDPNASSARRGCAARSTGTGSSPRTRRFASLTRRARTPGRAGGGLAAQRAVGHSGQPRPPRT